MYTGILKNVTGLINHLPWTVVAHFVHSACKMHMYSCILLVEVVLHYHAFKLEVHCAFTCKKKILMFIYSLSSENTTRYDSCCIVNVINRIMYVNMLI